MLLTHLVAHVCVERSVARGAGEARSRDGLCALHVQPRLGVQVALADAKVDDVHLRRWLEGAAVCGAAVCGQPCVGQPCVGQPCVGRPCVGQPGVGCSRLRGSRVWGSRVWGAGGACR
eukprot:355775-Chlamydomonas_euryale.AAC.6